MAFGFLQCCTCKESQNREFLMIFLRSTTFTIKVHLYLQFVYVHDNFKLSKCEDKCLVAISNVVISVITDELVRDFSSKLVSEVCCLSFENIHGDLLNVFCI